MILTFDTETTTHEKGNPFSRRNRLCAVGIHIDDGDRYIEFPIEYDGRPYGENLRQIGDLFRQATLLVGFNLKFDLHWIRRYLGDEFFALSDLRVWDCQLGEFLIGGQREPYPALNTSCERRGIGTKLDIVADQYWAKGIDTPDIPWETLSEYLKQDVLLTKQLYEHQQSDLSGSILALFEAQCDDLVVLQDAEFNGLRYNTAESLRLAAQSEHRLNDIDEALVRSFPCPSDFNWNSSDHLSVLIYGGKYYERARIPTQRVLKDGTVKHGEKWGYREHSFPQLCRPPKRSETLPTREWDDYRLGQLNAERVEKGQRPFVRVYATDEPTLRSLKGSKKLKKLIELLKERSEVEKLLTTYYRGLPELINQKDWPENEIHGQFNQCVAATGRLSSSGPNQQNFAGNIKELFYSRYA